MTKKRKKRKKENYWIPLIIAIICIIIVGIYYFHNKSLSEALNENGFSSSESDSSFYNKLYSTKTLEEYLEDVKNHINSEYEEYNYTKNSSSLIAVKMKYQGGTEMLKKPLAVFLVLALFAGIHFVYIQRLADNIGNGHTGIQRGIGILKNHGGFLPELVNVLFAFHGLAPVAYFTRCGFIQMQNRASNRGLAAARLPYQAKRLATLDGKAHVIHGFERRGLEEYRVNREVLLKMAHIHQWRIVCCHYALPPFEASSCAFTFIQQEALWVSLNVMFSGILWMHTFMALSQRGAKGHPLGRLSKSMGVPVMGCSFCPMVPVVGIERSKPLVYSCLGS